MTKSEYVLALGKLTLRQKKMIVAYLHTLDPVEAATIAGYSHSQARCARTKILPRLMPIIAYKLEKEKICDALVSKEWLTQQWLKLADSSYSAEKISALKELGKIYRFTSDSNISVNTNIEKPSVVTISFTKE